MPDAELSQSNIDFNFISELEGSSYKGYVPDPKLSQSGVTIASGFDIGQRSKKEIKQAFSGELCEKLLPYVEKIKDSACDALEVLPLTVSKDEAACINAYSHREAQANLVREWQAAQTYTEFHLLSCECQTVVASVAFQYGNLRMRTPNFWHQVTSGDWQGAYENLRHFGDKYATRRNKEADLLESWLTR